MSGLLKAAFTSSAARRMAFRSLGKHLPIAGDRRAGVVHQLSPGRTPVYIVVGYKTGYSRPHFNCRSLSVVHTENVAGGQTESFQNVGGAKMYTMY